MGGRYWKWGAPSPRAYRVTSQGDAFALATVEHSDDGVLWRETRNVNRRMIEHYRIHRAMPPGMDSDTWKAVEPKVVAAL